MITALVAALALSMDGSCAPLELVDVFGEVPFDTPVTSELIRTTLRGDCRDSGQSCRLRDRTGVIYEVAGGRFVSKTQPPGWSAELPFGLGGRSYGEIGDALIARGIPSEAIEIVIRNGPGLTNVAVCDHSLTLRIFQNTAGRARSVALVPTGGG